MKKKVDHPQWALDQKRPGTELRCIRGKYYLYECSSFYDKEKKKTRKKTGAYLGMITEEKGLVPPRRRQIEIENQRLDAEVASGKITVPEPKLGQVREYGLSSFITAQCAELMDNLKLTLPTVWNRIMAMAYCRLRNQSPLKYIQEDFSNSYLSQSLGTSGLSARSLTDFLKKLGKNREGILAFMRKYTGAGGNILFDGTDILSASAKMDFPRMSKTKLGGFAEAINLMMAFSTKQMLPVYYRILPGNVKDITAFLTSLDEFYDTSATAIGDKGFYSKKNVEELEKRKINYIIALRRSTAGIDYGVFDNHKSEGHFFYAGRLIKLSSQSIESRKVYLYYDAKHAAEEETDYLRRVDDEKYEEYTIETYARKAPQFGTIALMTSGDIQAKQAFDDYKSRCEIEQEIDVLKTDLDALTSYMQDNDRLEGWMFINFIALHIFYMIRRCLVESNLTDKMSTREAIRILCRQRIVRLNDEWRIAEASSKDKTQLEALGIPIT
ncbi:MAG: transposase [Bacteroides sp.]|nr:transposase [Bacteroides sp.]MBD5358849.1 transposase [Bacteroides sp.]